MRRRVGLAVALSACAGGGVLIAQT